MSERIRTGFIGCGGNASSHIGRVLQIPEAEIVALCDPSGDSLAKAKEQNAGARDLPEFSDYRQMLADVELDAVQISTPHTTHFEQIMACLDKGLH
ncbi:MAG: Gfo/Idh/MocA family oxidoreductase, partial [Candidatus Latescibacterota bacterium]|nr:Gfo/Idh/MocA family oxidoreductase [Candidatus Latescibacterota bacterium]